MGLRVAEDDEGLGCSAEWTRWWMGFMAGGAWGGFVAVGGGGMREV